MAAYALKSTFGPASLLRVVLAGLFIYAGAGKAWDPAAFASGIANYRITPWIITAGIAIYLPWLEILAGVGLLFPRFRSGALLIVSALLTVFCGALLSAWMRGLDIHCGCFGAGGTGIAPALIRNLVLLAACAFVWSRSRSGPVS